MTADNAWGLVKRSAFCDLGFIDENGMPNIRKVFNIWQYRSLSKHFISTNTSSEKVKSLLKNNTACLYYSDSDHFEGLCLYGKVIVHFENEYKRFFWNAGDEKYYPSGYEDADYCILEFRAEYGQYYGNGQKEKLVISQIDEAALGILPFVLNEEK